MYIEYIQSELDAFDIYSIFKDEKESVILDSSKGYEKTGRYSFVGINPFLQVKSCKGVCYINGEKTEENVFNVLDKILIENKTENNSNFPFVSGGIGFFSYDLGRYLEELPNTAKDDVEIPEVYFNFYDNIIAIDSLTGEVGISALGKLEEAEKSILKIKEKISSGKKVEINVNINDIAIDDGKFKSNFTKEEYVEAVDKMREYIRTGDIYIANMTRRFECEYDKEPYELYKILRHINPAPFASYMNLDGFTIASSSPERFLKIRDGKVETKPIKGTRPRGATPQEDEKNRLELRGDEKEQSELLMVVDLERNDVSKVSKPNSVKVTELFEVEKYPTVYHLVATIEGELKEDKSNIDCIKAMFPGGSITGTPKIRAMEVIEELEGLRRNIYTGSIGYLGFDRSVDLNIVIRTICLKDNKAYFGVGGGITWESNSEFEHEETYHKAYALMKALSYEG